MKNAYPSYHRKILDMLKEDTYVISDIDCSTLVKRTKASVERYKYQLHKKELEAITKQEAYTVKFYGLPKIHKSQVIKRSITIQNSEFILCPEPSDLKFRPIVSYPARVPYSRDSTFVLCVRGASERLAS